MHTNYPGHPIARRLAEQASTPSARRFWERVASAHEHGRDEFSGGQDQSPGSLSRRQLLALAGAGAALAGMTACQRRPRGEILPYASTPPELTPGVPERYATSTVIEGLATGLVVQAREGRPVKIEGNPQHPGSHGATLAAHQGMLLQLYDPDRARQASERGRPRPLQHMLRELAERPPAEGLWLVVPPQSSPLVLGLLERVAARHPKSRIAFHSPLSRSAAYRGAQLAFGRPLETHFELEDAHTVVCLDADLFAALPNCLRHTKAFGRSRRLQDPHDSMSRLYVAEAHPTPTGSLADHRLPSPPSRIPALAAALAKQVIDAGRPIPGLDPTLLAQAARGLPEAARTWARDAALDLLQAPSQAVIAVGDGQPAEVHALVHLIHASLGTLGERVHLFPSAVAEPTRNLDAHDLVRAIEAGEVRQLMLLDVDMVATAPAHLQLARHIGTLEDSLHFSLYFTETSAACGRFVPASHFLETWGDACAFDGTRSVVQPLIEPLHGTPSLSELLARLAGDAWFDDRAQLQAQFTREASTGDPAGAWQAYLARGLAIGSGRTGVAIQPSPHPDLGDRLKRWFTQPGQGLELQFVPSNSVYDGRFANVSWLQELPQPMTHLTWGNAALISPETAAEHGLQSGDVVRIETPQGHIELPALPVEGQPDGVVSVALGYGQATKQQRTARLAHGANAFSIWKERDVRHRGGVGLRATGAHHALAITQQFQSQHDRDIALATDLAAFRKDPDFTRRHRDPLPTLLPTADAERNGWVMTIDTSTCTGCSACMVACQAENNVPTVGPEGVRHGREMHWLRIDTYPLTSSERMPPDPFVRHVHQPMLCQHCAHAPCEYVCPVGATVHSHDGLNEMVYNRCVGTRFCSNNCPYKVRRFNWLQYNEGGTTRDLAFNPDVSVRDRGVMEKCSYCVQRIRRAEIDSRIRRHGPVPEGTVQTACQQACPTAAIQFGQLSHADSEAVRWRNQKRRYNALHELGTLPHTTYLAKIFNPKPEQG